MNYIILTSNLSLPGAFGISILGITIVFSVLVLLMVMIIIMSKSVHFFSTRQKKSEPIVVSPTMITPECVPEIASGSCGDIKLYNVSDRDAAMVMSVVADEMNTPISELRFISIKEVTDK